MPLELGVRYRAGRQGAQVVLADGSSLQLAPFAAIRFESLPVSIVGSLVRTRRRRRFPSGDVRPGYPPLETKRVPERRPNPALEHWIYE